MNLADTLLGMPEAAAPYVLGANLVSDIGGATVRLRVTEVEAYKGSEDPASHAFKGQSERNSSMFKRPGTMYVYRSYGVHWCANVAAGPVGTGWGILFRAGEILDGIGVVRQRRGRTDQLSNGPGKLTQALGIDGSHDGLDLFGDDSPVRLEPGEQPDLVMATPRIGISKAKDKPWRFVAATSASNGLRLGAAGLP